jgi:hypothetical protein
MKARSENYGEWGCACHGINDYPVTVIAKSVALSKGYDPERKPGTAPPSLDEDAREDARVTICECPAHGIRLGRSHPQLCGYGAATNRAGGCELSLTAREYVPRTALLEAERRLAEQEARSNELKAEFKEVNLSLQAEADSAVARAEKAEAELRERDARVKNVTGHWTPEDGARTFEQEAWDRGAELDQARLEQIDELRADRDRLIEIIESARAKIAEVDEAEYQDQYIDGLVTEAREILDRASEASP